MVDEPSKGRGGPPGGGGVDPTATDEQLALDAEHKRRHETPTAAEAAIDEELLRVQNDVRLSASEKRWRVARILQGRPP